MKKVKLLFIVLFLFSFILSACGEKDEESSANSEEGKEKEIVVYQMMRDYCSLAEDTIDEIMLEEYNTKVVCQDLSSAEAFTKIQSEKDDPVASVVVSDVNGTAAGIAGDYYEELDSEIVANLNEIDGEATEVLGDKMVAISYAAIGLTYRSDLFDEKGLEEPKKWEDLFDSNLEGEVGMYSSGISAPYEQLVSLAVTEGGDQENIDPGFEKMKKLVDLGQSHAFYDSGPMMYQALIDGEIMVGPGYSEGSLELAAENEDIEFVFPEDGFARSLRGASVIKDSPHQEEAMQYVNLLLSEEWQEILVEERFHSPVRDDLDIKDDDFLKDLEPKDGWDNAYDIDWVEHSKQHNERYERYSDEIERE